MTVDEYRKKVEGRIRKAATRNEAKSILDEASETLIEANIARVYVRQFWVALYTDLNFVIKEQRDTATHDIVAYALQVIAELSAEASK
jgi:hypothetical protein